MRKPKSKALIVMVAFVITLAGVIGRASAAYKTITVQDNGQRKVIRGFAVGTVSSFLERHGVSVNRVDRVRPSLRAEVRNRMVIVIRRPIQVALVEGAAHPHGQTSVVRFLTFSHTVGQLLKGQNIHLRRQDSVDKSLESKLHPGETIHVRRVSRLTSTLTQKIPFQTIRQRTQSLYTGQQRVLTYGVEGLQRLTTTRVFVNGKKAAVHVRRQLLKKPVNEVIEVGSTPIPQPKQTSQLSGRSGGTLAVLRSITVVATAYVGGGRTATGEVAGPGIIAVDPSVIPLGTKLYIPGVGEVQAEDTGGAIVGNRIDICMSTWQEAESFGERTLTIYELQ